jgi:hypothetical protein
VGGCTVTRVLIVELGTPTDPDLCDAQGCDRLATMVSSDGWTFRCAFHRIADAVAVAS